MSATIIKRNPIYFHVNVFLCYTLICQPQSDEANMPRMFDDNHQLSAVGEKFSLTLAAAILDNHVVMNLAIKFKE